MTEIAQHVVDAISLGSLYALFALGIGLVFGVVRVVNFAHGELIMIGSYIIVLVSSLYWPLVVLAVVAGGIAAAVIMERAVFRPVRSANPATLLVAAFAASVLIQNLFVLLAGARAKTVDFGSALTRSTELFGVRVTVLDLVGIGVTGLLLLGLVIFLRKTALGTQLRAAAEDFTMARVVGVRANRVIATAFAISGLLAGVAGLLIVAQTGTVTPDMGLEPLLIAFIATVIGGLGSLPGAVVGGFALGAMTVGFQVGLPADLSPFRDAFVFLLVIIVLLLRPQGLIPHASAQERV